MAVHRVICRWDFKLSPALMDNPGAVCAALGVDDWGELKENWSKRQFTLVNEQQGLYEQFTFSPIVAIFSAEWAEGVPVHRLATHNRLLNLFHCLDVIKERGAVRELRRCGLRFHDLDRLLPNVEPPEDGGQALIEPILLRCHDLSQAISGTAGRIEDASLKFVGEHEDKIKYMVQIGPFNDQEKPKFFEHIHDDWIEPTRSDFMCDADFSELDFELTVSTKQWASPIIARFAETLKSCKLNITGGQRG